MYRAKIPLSDLALNKRLLHYVALPALTASNSWCLGLVPDFRNVLMEPPEKKEFPLASVFLQLKRPLFRTTKACLSCLSDQCSFFSRSVVINLSHLVSPSTFALQNHCKPYDILYDIFYSAFFLQTGCRAVESKTSGADDPSHSH